MQGARTVDNPEGEEEVLVKTEFVWADGAEKDVKLAGSWNGWMPIQMYHEGGEQWKALHLLAMGRGGLGTLTSAHRSLDLSPSIFAQNLLGTRRQMLGLSSAVD